MDPIKKPCIKEKYKIQKQIEIKPVVFQFCIGLKFFCFMNTDHLLNDDDDKCKQIKS